MNDYVPSTGEVRDTYFRHWEYCEDWASIPNMTNRAVAGFGSEFDRWLAAYARQVKADAWDEGFMDCANWWEIHHASAAADIRNPYRITEENN